MFGESAPYVVAILVSVASWTISNYHSQLSSVRFLSIEKTEKETEENKSNIYRFTNKSSNLEIKNITISLVCPTPNPCFESTPASGGLYAQKLLVPPWGVTEELSQDAEIASITTSLPANTAFELRSWLKNLNQPPYVLISQESSETNTRLKIVEGFDAELFVANNFLLLVAFLWAGTAVILIYIYYGRRNVNAPKQPEIVHVKMIG